MKVALIHNKYKMAGGTERAIITLAEALAGDGHQAHIFCSQWDKTENKNIIFHKVPVANWFKPLELISFVLFSKMMLEKEKFDIIHSFDRTIYQDILRVGGGCHKEFLKSNYPSGTDPLRLFNKFNLNNFIICNIENINFRKRKNKKIIAVSNRCKEDILKNYNIPARDIRVIYNGVDTARFNPQNQAKYREQMRKLYGISDKDILILYIGSGYKRKGVDYLIRAIADLKRIKDDLGFKVFILGRESRMNVYKQRAKQLKLKNEIIFTGEKTDVEKFYAASDIFVLPTLYEPFANVCLEALASGLPVITSKVNGASEIMTDDRNALLLDNPRDVSEITYKIVELLDERRRKSFAQEARKTAENYSTEVNYRKVMDIYREVLHLS